ncbi:heme exporter protein CcmD [Vreelandella sp. EE22]
MAFASLQDFFAMGSHGVFVWSAWGVTILLLVLSLLQAILERRRLINTLKRRARREHARRSDARPGSATSSQSRVHDDA